MATWSSLSPFLALPRELRDQIYNHFIFITQPPPSTPQQCGDRATYSRPTWGFRAPDFKIHPQSEFPKRGILPLILVNHQIKDEVEDLMHRMLNQKVPDAEMDLMLKGYEMWPTWTYIPLLPLVLNNVVPVWNVRVNMRIFSTDIFAAGLDGTARRCEYGSLFGTFLCEFLWGGANRQSRFRTKPPMVHIQTLTVDVEFLDIYLPSTHPPAFALIVRQLETIANNNVSVKAVRGIVVRAVVDAEAKVWKESGVATEATVKVISELPDYPP